MNKVLRALVGATYLITAMSGCYRYELTPDAVARNEELEGLENRGRRQSACDAAWRSDILTGRVLATRAKCVPESKEKAVEETEKERMRLYTRAATCGDPVARDYLAAHQVASPKDRYEVGGTTVLLFDSRSENCGLEREVTPTGWAVAPIAAPAYIVGVTAGTAALIALIPVAIVLGGVCH